MAINRTSGTVTGGNTNETAMFFDGGDYSESGAKIDWGRTASRSVYAATGSLTDDASGRSLLQSRLFHGVPQVTEDMIKMFDAAYQGHTFIFVTEMPKFLTTGIYKNTRAHELMKNFKSIVERASTSYDGAPNIEIETQAMTDGNYQIANVVNVTDNQQSQVSLTLHEFAGLPVRNALYAWATGMIDPQSKHGSYLGNLNIPGGWSLQNHTMAMLVVQLDPSWTVIQDAIYWYNMIPDSVDFSSMSWQKHQFDIIDNKQITFSANHFRGPAIDAIAEVYVRNRILTLVETSVYNSRQFVPSKFLASESEGLWAASTNNMIYGSDNIMDNVQYNQRVTKGGNIKSVGTKDDGTTTVTYNDDNKTPSINKYTGQSMAGIINKLDNSSVSYTTAYTDRSDKYVTNNTTITEAKDITHNRTFNPHTSPDVKTDTTTTS